MSKQVDLLRACTFDKIVVVPGVTQSQVHSIQAVQKPWSNRMKDVPDDTQRQMPTMLKNTEVVNPVRTSQVQYIDEIVKGPSDHAEAGADDAEDAERTKKKTPDTCVSQQTRSTRESQCRAKHLESADKEKTHKEQSRAAPEETVPDEVESSKDPPDMKTGRSMRSCLSRVVPEARSQVKVKKKSNVAAK